ncbi:YdcF family protein [Bisgaard Taxon 10/6]|uniref:YdcF family protein n=1 Tax=Exercitatus varius TaxID=67857 RepID=A0ABT6ETP2_9PAST|nr:YdcF family protein [Exercitatus varius]MDG2938883.1 YdcF family protein [Exercitatus varius]MDG2945918.1 YdcF family protein [Exercitatus varius]
MIDMTKLITAIILPPFDVLILLVLAFFLRLFRFKKLAFLTALLSVVILYTFSIPYTAERLNNSLTQEDHLTADDYRKAQAIVILGGGLRDSKELFNTLTVPGLVLERMRYAAYLHKETELPILISGASPNGNSEAKVMGQEFFTFFGVQPKWLEEHSTNTKQNALYSKEILERENIKRIVLVTNQWHMKRAKMLFEQQGFEVLPASVGPGIIPDSYELNAMHFIPQAGALAANMQLLKEWIGYWKEQF